MAFGVGVSVPPIAYWAGFDAGQRAADQEAVFRGVQQVMRMGLSVAVLRDTVQQLRRAIRAQTIERLPPHVRDSLREARWTGP